MNKYCGGGEEGAFQRYLERYLKTDILLIVDIVENLRSLFRDTKGLGLELLQYLTGPQAAWDAMLLVSGSEIELLCEDQRDILDLFVSNIRGGQVVKNETIIRGNFLGAPNFDPKKPVIEPFYTDVNALYSHQMMHKLPHADYQRMDPKLCEHLFEKRREEYRATQKIIIAERPSLLEWHDTLDESFALLVDLDYVCASCWEKGHTTCGTATRNCPGCRALHDAVQDYPPCPIPRKVQMDEVSPTSHADAERAGVNLQAQGQKLVLDVGPRKDYPMTLPNLIRATERGIRVVKFKGGVSYKQDFVMRPWIEWCMDQRKQAKEDGNAFGIMYFKYLSNICYGKSIQSPLKQETVKLIHAGDRNARKKMLDAFKNPLFKAVHRFGKDLIAIHIRQAKVRYNKPVPLGFAILEGSKEWMGYWHCFLKSALGGRYHFGDSDTDAFIGYVERQHTDPMNMLAVMKLYPHMFDLSDFDSESILHDKSGSKVPGRMGEECPISFTESNGLNTRILKAVEENVRAHGIDAEGAKQIACRLTSDIVDVIMLAAKIYSLKRPVGHKHAQKGLKRVCRDALEFEDYEAEALRQTKRPKCYDSGALRYQYEGGKLQHRVDIISKRGPTNCDIKRFVHPDGTPTAYGHYSLARGAAGKRKRE